MLPGPDNQSAVVSAQNFARSSFTGYNLCIEDFQLQDAARFVSHKRKRTWPWIERANFALNYFSGLRPIDFAVVASQFRRVGGARIVLRNARCTAFRKHLQSLEQCLRRNLGQSIMQ